MQLAGFDVQLHGQYSQAHFSGWMENLLHERKLLEAVGINANANFMQTLDSIVYHSKRQTSVSDTFSLKRFQIQLAQVEAELIKHKSSAQFESQMLKSLKSQVLVMLWKSRDNISAAVQERDRQMADNLHWLMTYRFSGRKVIVWAANVHIYGAPFEQVLHYVPQYPMGYLFKKMNTGLPVYILGFTSYSGSAQRISGNLYSFESNARNSLEAWVHKSRADYAFIDLDKAKAASNKRQAFLMAGAGHYQTKQHWTDGFNGIFYFKKMNPCVAVQ